MKTSLKRFVTESQVKLKLSEIIDAGFSLREISKIKLPVLLSFQISLFLKSVNPIFESYNENRKKLLEEFGILNLEKNKYDFPIKGNENKYNKKYQELISQEIEINIPNVKLSDLGDIKIEPGVLESLTWFFKE
ncbi:MAG: hypothetical protein WC511_06740 [Candidatus Pacearchaeota archaeon]|jgi:hypothetical protein